MWHSINALVRRTIRLWFGQEKNPVKGGSKTTYSGNVPYKVTNYNSVKKDASPLRINGDLTVYREGNFANTIEESKEGRVLEINKWGISACNRGNPAGDAGNIFDNRFFGFIGHEGIPWLWDSREGCWRPVTESSYASEYAALQGLVPPTPEG